MNHNQITQTPDQVVGSADNQYFAELTPQQKRFLLRRIGQVGLSLRTVNCLTSEKLNS